MTSSQRLFVIVGTPGSGKDLIIRAIDDLGTQHARIVPKHTSRSRRADDQNEMICPGDPGYDLEGCDIPYENYDDKYGIKTENIWEGLRNGFHQLVTVSDIMAINRLRDVFGELMVLVYVHSNVTPEEYREKESSLGEDTGYVERRAAKYQFAFDAYLENFLAFQHTLIFTGVAEDLYDQIFRLFRAYRLGNF
jgi:ribose 1,5-bisphosphokinase PhnN